MSLETLETSAAEPAPGGSAERGAWIRVIAMTLGPIAAALVLSGAILLTLGVDPLAYYATVLERGLLSPYGLQATVTRMAPLLLLAASLIVAFRAGIWNLGGDGQFLLGAVTVAAAGPLLATVAPVWLTLVLCLVLGAAVGAAWSLLPALLRAYQGVNEIITTLMMTFLGVSFANVLVKLAFRDPATTVPQTRTLVVDDRLPRLFGTTISSGVIIGLVAIVAVHLVMTRTAFGLKLRVVGANATAAIHAGLNVPRLTVAVFAISAGLAGMAGAVEILGVQGNVRADWNPAYSLTVVPLVFLARFNGFAAIVFVFLFSVLSIGGESAARRLGVPNFFTLAIVAILLIVLALAEYLDQRRRERIRS
ncbi:putative B6 ABC transporter permease subunit 2 [Labrys wisconsinensis]|uniref:Simple sugar transport system permease protein n=1 Tax=Labrys wisconsinensis TaxID=425677 RepID=A0ABU0J0I9_9HYPH|nr:ABC transporter permease [Labrys wisconsinensis]MDQ0467785.1 simple sugar transport system permease protein [Labrys wisconsinensis]